MLLQAVRAGPSKIARGLHTTSALHVKRPQVPFKVNWAPVEPYSGTRAKSVPKYQLKELEVLEGLRHGGRSAAEKYGTQFGIARQQQLEAPTKWTDVVRQFRGGLQVGTKLKPPKKRKTAEVRQMKLLRERLNPRRDDIDGRVLRDSAPHMPTSAPRSKTSQTGQTSVTDRTPWKERKPVKEQKAYGKAPWQSRPGNDGPERRIKPPRPSNFGLRVEGTRNAEPTSAEDEPELETRPGGWAPTKKLTFAAMAAVRELHAQDPEQWTRAALGKQFGVSYEAISRILRSKWSRPSETQKISTKWTNALDSRDNLSPVSEIQRVFNLKREMARQAKEEGEGL